MHQKADLSFQTISHIHATSLDSTWRRRQTVFSGHWTVSLANSCLLQRKVGSVLLLGIKSSKAKYFRVFLYCVSYIGTIFQWTRGWISFIKNRERKKQNKTSTLTTPSKPVSSYAVHEGILANALHFLSWIESQSTRTRSFNSIFLDRPRPDCSHGLRCRTENTYKIFLKHLRLHRN